MPVLVTCSNCGAKLKAPDDTVGREAQCPKCGGIIPVPSDGEEVVDLAVLGVRSVPPGPASAGPASRRQMDENDDGPRASRRRREYEDDDDYDDDDEPGYPRGSVARAQGGGLQLGLGIASLSVGILGLLISWIPVVGSLICGAGLVLGAIAVIVALRNGRRHGFPIAGSVVSGVALAVSLVLTFVMLAMARNMGDVERQMAQNMQNMNLGGAPAGPLTPPVGAIVLADGRGQFEGELVAADPFDRVQVKSRCKVFTVDMKAGRAYQIDLIRKKGIRKKEIRKWIGDPRLKDVEPRDPDGPFLRLEDAAGNQLMFDGDGGGHQNARILFVCPRNANFRIVATTSLGATGAFTLKVEER